MLNHRSSDLGIPAESQPLSGLVEAGAEHLVRQAESLFALIQFARSKIAGLHKIPVGTANAERLVRGSAIAGLS
jgi:hypothetical protein